jgi:hypothetical protein
MICNKPGGTDTTDRRRGKGEISGAWKPVIWVDEAHLSWRTAHLREGNSNIKPPLPFCHTRWRKKHRYETKSADCAQFPEMESSLGRKLQNQTNFPRVKLKYASGQHSYLKQHVTEIMDIRKKTRMLTMYMYIHFVNFEKAFDSVHRDSLWIILKNTVYQISWSKCLNHYMKTLNALWLKENETKASFLT